MPGRRGRHLDLGPPRRAGTDPALVEQHGKPDLIVSRPRHRVHLERDAGLERRCRRALAFSSPRASRCKSGICEAFNSKMRDELLNETLFFGLDHAREIVARWVADYNLARPHSALDYQTPAAFAAQLTANGRSAPRNGSVPLLAHCSLRASGQLSDVGSGFSWMSVGGQSSIWKQTFQSAANDGAAGRKKWSEAYELLPGWEMQCRARFAWLCRFVDLSARSFCCTVLHPYSSRFVPERYRCIRKIDIV